MILIPGSGGRQLMLRDIAVRNLNMVTTPFVQKIADKIIELGLAMPAILLLETHKPLAFLGSQLLLIAQPTLNIFLPQDFVRNLAELLAEPEQFEQLIVRLEMNNPSAINPEQTSDSKL